MSTRTSAALRRVQIESTSASHRYVEDRFHDVLLILVAVFIFSPYIAPSLGVRGEQLVVYPVLLLLIVSVRMPDRYWRDISVLPVAWGALVPIGMLGSVWMSLQSDYQLSWTSVIATTDSILLGAAVAWIASAVVARSKDPLRTFRRLALALVVMTALNGVLAMVSTFVNTTQWLSVFWSADGSGATSVAAKALTGNRYSGVFNQPYEAGFAHSVGLLLWCYLYVHRKVPAKWLMLLSVPLMVGGILPFSKVFLFGGLPLSLGYLAWSLRARGLDRRTLVMLLSVLMSSLVVSYGLPDAVLPVDRFTGLFGEDVLFQVSGGRYGAEGVLGDPFARLMDSPVVGFGLDPQSGALDNVVLGQMDVGGMVGMLALVIVLWTLARGVIEDLRKEVSAVSRLHALLLLLFLAAMLGAHPLLVNRSGSLFLLVVGALRGRLTPTASAGAKLVSRQVVYGAPTMKAGWGELMGR